MGTKKKEKNQWRKILKFSKTQLEWIEYLVHFACQPKTTVRLILLFWVLEKPNFSLLYCKYTTFLWGRQIQLSVEITSPRKIASELFPKPQTPIFWVEQKSLNPPPPGKGGEAFLTRNPAPQSRPSGWV